MTVVADQTSFVELGLRAFLRGFSARRSLAHPYPVRQVSPSLWVLADAPRARGNARESEVIVHGATPDDAVDAIQREALGRHVLCVLLDSPEEAAANRHLYKQRGYRFAGTEVQFVLPTNDHIRCDAFPVRRIMQKSEADAIGKAARGRQVLPQHLDQMDAPIRLYGAFENETPIGWVSSITTDSPANWVANLFVRPEYRRQGIGKSLMSLLLEEDARYGVRFSALIASQTGALLYPQLGYEPHGLLLVFFSPKGGTTADR
jgi:GNAT superfamily N-acetyltransferase